MMVRMWRRKVRRWRRIVRRGGGGMINKQSKMTLFYFLLSTDACPSIFWGILYIALVIWATKDGDPLRENKMMIGDLIMYV
jgi:hypothetical protein